MMLPLPLITSVPAETAEQWLFTDDEIEHSPSSLQGLSGQEERERRAKGVAFIAQVGLSLKLPQATITTGAMFFHRMFMRIGMVEKQGGLHHYTVAATALFLATKSEENIRKTKEIVIAVARVASKNPSLVIDEQSKEFWRWKDIILNYEETMLEKLTFDVVVENPHSHMYHIISELGLYDNKAIRDHSWAFIADSTFTTAGLQVSPRELAIASVFWAARIGNVKIPNGSDGSPWWIRIKGTPEKMVKAVRIVVDYFHENPLRKVKNPYGGTPKFDEADLEKTRQALPKAPTLFHPSATTNIDSPQMAPKKTPSVQSTKEQLDGSNGIDSKLDSDHAQTSKSLDHEMSMSAPQSVQGDDDKLLKEAANDLSTHERLNAEARLTQRSIKSQASSLSRKRKADDSDADMSQSEANRSKAISEASEDGELAE